MAARNDITGTEIKSKALSKQGQDNWDEIFGKKTASEWMLSLFGRDDIILDPDGWRQNDGVELDTKITKDDFYSRFNLSTIQY